MKAGREPRTGRTALPYAGPPVGDSDGVVTRASPPPAFVRMYRPLPSKLPGGARQSNRALEQLSVHRLTGTERWIGDDLVPGGNDDCGRSTA